MLFWLRVVMEKPVCSMYGVMLMRHLGQSGPLHSTACAVWWPDHRLLHSVGMVRHTVLYCRWACSLGPSSSQCLPVPDGFQTGGGWWLVARGWQRSCLCLTVQACFHLLAAWKQVQLWAGAAARRTVLLIVLRCWQRMVQGQLQQIP